MPAINPINVPLPADLPTNWQLEQIVSPDGISAGLAEQYGYNYLMEQVNAAQMALQQLAEYFPNLATENDIGGFVEMVDPIPIVQRQNGYLYGQIIADFTQTVQLEGGN